MKKLITPILFFISSVLFLMASDSPFKTPDFAFPKQVSATATKDLDKALHNNNSPLALRSLINLGLADNEISGDSKAQFLNMALQIQNRPQTPDELKALILILRADIYSSIYNADKWTYNQRELPLSPLPENYTEWSGEQFKMVICSLADSALNYSSQLADVPLKDYNGVINTPGYPILYPTLLDFVAYKAIDLTTFNNYSYDKSSFTPSPDNVRLSALNNLKKFNKPGSAPSILTEITELGNLSDNPQGTTTRKLSQIYEENKLNPYSAIPLLIHEANISDLELKKTIYFQLDEYLKAFPQSLFAEHVESRMKQLCSPSAVCLFNEMVAKNSPLKVEVKLRNAQKTNVALYSVKKSESKYGRSYLLDKLIEETTVAVESNGPCVTKKEVQFNIPDYGLYTVVAYPCGKTVEADMHFDLCYCTDLYPMAITAKLKNYTDSVSVFVADLLTGLPVSGVKVWGKPVKSTPQLPSSGVTDNDGQTSLFVHNKIFVERNDDKYSKQLSIYNSYIIYPEKTKATITTSLPLYHFGDSLQWMAVVYDITKNGTSQPARNRSVRAQFRSPDYNIIDSVTLTTDSWGRVTGCFNIPRNTLAGNFRISIFEADSDHSLSETSVMVSDYKLPTFTTEITDIQRDVPAKGNITLTGKAISYSGFPVENAKVVVDFKVSMGYSWWNSSTVDLFNTVTETDNSGKFTVILPDSITSEIIGDKAITANASVTSMAGETRAASTRFTVGKPYIILINSSENINTENPQRLNIEVLKPDYQKVNIPIIVKLYRQTDIYTTPTDSDNDEYYYGYEPNKQIDKLKGVTPAAIFNLDSPDSEIDFRKVTSGLYIMTVEPVNPDLANTEISSELFFFSSSQKNFPLDRIFWTDRSQLNLNSQKGEMLVATACDKLSMLMVTQTNEEVLSTKWVNIKKGMSHIPVELPAGVSKAKIVIMGVNNARNFEHEINVTAPSNKRSFDFRLESFRDKVAPLSSETWKFRTAMANANDTIPCKSAVILQMFSKAVNDIQPMGNIYFYSPTSPNLIRTFYNNIYKASFSVSQPYKFKDISIMTPRFNLYGLSWNKEIMMLYGAARSAKLATAGSINSNAMADEVADLGTIREYREEVFIEESESKADESNNSTNYRPSEIPLALFEPTLTTGPDGYLEYSVTFPDASTTWILNATAYNDGMLSEYFEKEIIASHPLMIQTANPRFLRLGDSTVLSATVMNNTDSDMADIATLFEAINPATGKVVASISDTISLQAMRSAVIELPVAVESLTPGLLIRAKASSTNYTDGEQSMIAILEASQPVVETKPFFMNPQQKVENIDINPADDAEITLEFYQNPTWSVVTALPGLRSDKYSTSPDAASALFSAAIADNLLKQNPEIATAIRTWLASDQADSTLVSMLQRNPDLKIALLEASPWMTDAMNDTQRMQRLALLFDRKEINNVYDSAIHELAKLQRSKGWAWNADNNKPSYWATLQTLEIISSLISQNCLPENKQLNEMIKNAVEFIDAETVALNRNKNKVSPDYYYTLVRPNFKSVRQPSAAKRITEATVQHIVANWKSMPIRQKAFAAIILDDNGYHSTARHIVSSIAEFAIETPAMGMHWDNAGIGTTARILEAYHMTGQPSAEIDAIRQWLILEKGRSNWGSSADCSAVINVILSTGSHWTPSSPGTAVIMVGETPVKPSRLEAITGYLRTDITNLVNGKPATVSISRSGDTPAYGSVYMIGNQRMESIEPSASPDLSISKRFLVRQLSDNNTSWAESTSFKVGDMVKVSTTITVGVDMQYVAIVDKRPACLEPTEQLPEHVFSEGLFFYRETDDSESKSFITYLPKGTYILEQTFTVTNPGRFTSGIASVQSQYAPEFNAHSAGFVIECAK